MNTFTHALNTSNNYTFTENMATTYRSTMSGLLDMFALGGAYRTRSDADCILLFKKAYEEDALRALKCLFYLRNVRGGQGERRFFRVVLKWLAKNHPGDVIRNLENIPFYGRWDDLYALVGTPVEDKMFYLMKQQLVLDLKSKTPSLLAKWLKSENTSSHESRQLATLTRKKFNLTSREYRKALSSLRERIRVLERLMSAKRWNEIEFDKIPSRAGMIYRNAFARHDIERQKIGKTTYEDFMKDTKTKVNAKALYPYECVAAATNVMRKSLSWCSDFGSDFEPALDDVNRLAVNKYWENLADYFKGAALNGIAVVDTSGSMRGSEASAPINVAISLGLYCAEHNKGPFAGHYISFSSRPQWIATEGVDFCDKVARIYRTNLCENTDIEATFDLLLKIALRPNVKKEDIPQNVIIISDMEFDAARQWKDNSGTLMEHIADKWRAWGLKMPNLIFWNVQARQNNIPMTVKDGITFVSGFSPVLFEQIMKGKTAFELMLDVLDGEMYARIK
mgnify:FL=1|jgi:hypothetical protein